MIEILKAGLLTTVQDLGRPGYAHLGVARSGALDRPALVRANRLVGNADGAAGLETTLTGVTLRARQPTVLAVTGARAALTVDGEPVQPAAALPVPAGAVVRVAPAESGVRSYLAFVGGVTVAPVLGSRSTDTLSGLGPTPLRPGVLVPLGQLAPTASAPHDLPADPASARRPEVNQDQLVTLRVRMGPRHDWFSFTARDALLATPYTLTVKSNRVGARLAGERLTRTTTGELPSEGIVLGAVQVPADGQPLVFLADHPTTGGYPVIAVVCVEDLPLLAQSRPGTTVRFVPWT